MRWALPVSRASSTTIGGSGSAPRSCCRSCRTRSPTRPPRPRAGAARKGRRSIRTARRPATVSPRRSSTTRSTSSRRSTRTRVTAPRSSSRGTSISGASMRFEPADVLARDAVVRELMRPLAPILAEEGATEVVVNRPGQVFVESGPLWRAYDAPQLTLERCLSLAHAVATYTEQDVGPTKPILSAMLPDGERIQIVLPPAVEPGCISLSIRKPAQSIRSFDDYERDGAFGRYVWARP